MKRTLTVAELVQENWLDVEDRGTKRLGHATRTFKVHGRLALDRRRLDLGRSASGGSTSRRTRTVRCPQDTDGLDKKTVVSVHAGHFNERKVFHLKQTSQPAEEPRRLSNTYLRGRRTSRRARSNRKFLQFSNQKVNWGVDISLLRLRHQRTRPHQNRSP